MLGFKVKRELEEGWFQQIEMPTAGGADDSIGRKQAALRNADGHQEGQDERAAGGERCGAWRGRRRRRSCSNRFPLPKKQKSTQILPGSPKEAAAALVEKLKSRRGCYERSSGCGWSSGKIGNARQLGSRWPPRKQLGRRKRMRLSCGDRRADRSAGCGDCRSKASRR